MAFYDEWKKEPLNKLYLSSFLKQEEESVLPLLTGTPEEIREIIILLLSIPVENYIDSIEDINYEIESHMIPQFSNFEHAISTVALAVESHDEDLGFMELGGIIMGSKMAGAREKYGENQAKIAKECSYVYFEMKNRKNIVKLTSLGKVSTCLELNMNLELCKRLLLRNELVRKLLFEAKKGKIEYNKIASCLKPSTLERRRSNVKYIVLEILKNSKYENLNNNIIWGKGR